VTDTAQLTAVTDTGVVHSRRFEAFRNAVLMSILLFYIYTLFCSVSKFDPKLLKRR
jgi:hypothetical protein